MFPTYPRRAGKKLSPCTEESSGTETSPCSSPHKNAKRREYSKENVAMLTDVYKEIERLRKDNYRLM